MLRHLRVTNFALLSDVSIEFHPGFNVLTGETGAGKSLIVEAVNLLRGGRASADIPREGAKQATVEAIFEVPPDLLDKIAAILNSAGLSASGDEVIVRRVLERIADHQIRSRTYINGDLTTARRLAEIGALLVDLSGQHQHQGLVNADRHRTILDLFGEITKQTMEMTQAWNTLQKATQSLDVLKNDVSPEQLDFLRFQVEELDAANVTDPTEDAHLAQAERKLQSIEQLQTNCHDAESSIYSGDNAAVDQLSAAIRHLEAIVSLDETLAGPIEQLQEAAAITEDTARTLSDYLTHLDTDPETLATTRERNDLLNRMKRKYGPSLGDVVDRHTALRQQLTELENRDGHIVTLEDKQRALHTKALKVAAKLTRARNRAAEQLSRSVRVALQDLDMPLAQLVVSVSPRVLCQYGTDDVEYLLASNPGEPAKPLAKVASGGELSRIMLALKLALRRADEVACYVFDEVDAGIGGTTAQAVGKYIHSLAQDRQVLCVTHLAQIAAFADFHYHVSKHVTDGRTETLVRQLTPSQRTEETARMLGGARITKHARAHASEMLKAANP